MSPMFSDDHQQAFFFLGGGLLALAHLLLLQAELFLQPCTQDKSYSS